MIATLLEEKGKIENETYYCIGLKLKQLSVTKDGYFHLRLPSFEYNEIHNVKEVLENIVNQINGDYIPENEIIKRIIQDVVNKINS